MKKTARINFQFSIFNFQSNLNSLKFLFNNSLKISNFKFQIILLAFSFLFLFFIKPNALAQNNSQQVNPYIAPDNNPDVPKNMHTWIQSVMVETMSAMVCQLSGINVGNPNEKCLGIDPKTGKVGFVEGGGGAIGFVNTMIATLYTPPLHTSDYFAYLGENFGLVKHAYAQGVGLTGVRPLVPLWTMMRNIVYLLFIIAFVIVGLAIMLRVKIDPRTVMTIENQIPKIIIGLIFVTFSLAIGGFLIDIMYLLIYFIFSLVANAGLTDVSALNPSLMQGKTAIEAAQGLAGTGGLGGFTNNIAGSLKDVIHGLLGINTCPNGPISLDCWNNIFNPAQPLLNMFMGTAVNNNPVNWLFGIISTAFGWTTAVQVKDMADQGQWGVNILGTGLTFDTKTFASVAGVVAGGAAYGAMQVTLRELLPWLIVYLIIFTAILWSLFRLWFQLLTAYISILVDILIAPFWIIAGLVPGSSLGIGAWLRDIGANLAAFPATIAMFLLGKVLVDAFSQQSATAFTPPLIGNPTPYGQSSNPIGSLIGLGIILMTPQVVSMMKEMFKAPQFKAAGGLGQALGVAPGLVGGLATAVASPYGSLAMYRGVKKEFAGSKIPGFIKKLGIPKTSEAPTMATPTIPEASTPG